MAGYGSVSADRGLLAASPVHRAMSEMDAPLELFESVALVPSGAAADAMGRSLSVARRHVAAGTVYSPEGMVAPEVVADLAGAGYWGLRAGSEYGGSGASFGVWAPFVAQMVTADPWVAGLSSPHAALGPVNLIGRFGNEEQKKRLLPPLARGERLGVFAVTEPGTASDLGAIRTTAARTGDRLVLTGQKLFISNAAPGRTAAVLCQLDGRLTMLIVELPPGEDDRFQTVSYDLRAPRHITNRALVFDRFPVRAANVLDADGRSAAYHGLNHGRVLVCAFAAGILRLMAGILIPWVQTRETFGAVIGSRELVQRRLGRLAARIVACDALVAWASQLLDQGYRGELECVAAKVFGSEAIKEATVDILLKTYASRAFLPGNLFSDSVYDLLAPAVYEGENEILTLGFFSSLVKARRTSPGPGLPPAQRRPAPPPDLTDLAAAAVAELQEAGSEIDSALRHDGAALAQHQAAAVELAQRVQQATVMLVVARYGARQADPLVRQAAVCMASELAHRLSGNRPTAAGHRMLTDLGAAVAQDQFTPLADVTRGTVAMPFHVPIAGRL
ncbi:MAG: acyl-CoA dehydrogenase family protein [Micromonosporaceae bacterium]